jgi:serine/threonine-protein kinase
MSERHKANDDPSSESAALPVDQVCGQFDAAWKAAASTGRRPCIDDYLRLVPVPERPALLHELIVLDMDYRQLAGEHPLMGEYRARFSAQELGLADQPTTLCNTDGDLLFGVFALHMDFINRDALVAAMNARLLDKTKPLGQILTEQGAVRPEDRDLLERLVKRHLQMHGDQTQLSLASLNSIGSLPNHLREIANPKPHTSLANMPGATTPQTSPRAAWSSAVQKSNEQAVRFRIIRDHAEGGLGKVFLAQDEELHREVALKEIKEKYAHHPESRLRFLREAEVTGGLEHPGIVPVYGLGRYADGRLFYAMRFIKGHSLHEAIQRFYAADPARRDPGERSLAFRELLGRFVDACNALAYAHARGVLHRDVKPHNIMLGKYGETLVVDWGLAKVIGHSEGLAGSEEGTLPPPSGDDTPPTQVGSIMGTPAYMSPEQADGRLDQLKPASDIYGLGATLYELLTGQRPFDGRDILVKVRRGEWLPPRRVRKDVPPALDQVCRKALALRPEERYASALDLAADIEHWLADEPVTAYREPWSWRLRRWMRRHRGMAAGVAGLLVAAVVAMAVGLVAVDHQKRRAEQAVEALEKAKRETRRAFEIVCSPVIEDWLSRQKGKLEPAQKDLLNKALDSYRAFTQESGDSEEARSGVAKAHRRVGDLSSSLGQHQAAEAAYHRAIDYYGRLVADFPTALDYHQELASSYNQFGTLLAELGRHEEAERAYRVALDLQQRLLDPHKRGAGTLLDMPDSRLELAKIHINLGVLLRRTGHPQKAEQAYRDALELQQQLAADFPAIPAYRGDLAATHNNLGNLLLEMRRLTDAEKAYRDALAVYRQLADQFPTLAVYRQVLATISSNLGRLLTDMERLPEAIEVLREAVALSKQLADQFPAVPKYREELANCHNNLGIALKDANRPEEAEKAYRHALDLQKQLAAGFPAVPGHRQKLARSHNNLGALLAELGRSRDAENAYRDALALQKQLAVEFNLPDYHNELANTMVNLAELLRDRREFLAARELLGSAAVHHQAALKANPQNPIYRLVFRNDRIILTSVLAGLGDHAAAQQTAEQLAALGWDPAEDAYAAARAMAQCAAVLEKDTKLREAQGQELVQSYTEQALALLRQAIRNGYHDASHMNKDPDLHPLRARPEFQKLLQELAVKSGSK